MTYRITGITITLQCKSQVNLFLFSTLLVVLNNVNEIVLFDIIIQRNADELFDIFTSQYKPNDCL